jgi:hypothetical protein
MIVYNSDVLALYIASWQVLMIRWYAQSFTAQQLALDRTRIFRNKLKGMFPLVVTCSQAIFCSLGV